MNGIIAISKEKSNRGTPKRVKKICEWTNIEFWIDWKYRHQRFKDIKTMHDWRSATAHEIVNCLNCGTSFERYKNWKHRSSGKPAQYCSNYCSVSSIEKRKKLQVWANSEKNHWNTKNAKIKLDGPN